MKIFGVVTIPGINVVAVKDYDNSLAIKFFNCQKYMNHESNYKNTIFVENNQCMIGSTRYDEYPLKSWKWNNCVIIQEGLIYNKSISEINSVISNIVLQNRKSSISPLNLKKFLIDSDGEYIIIIYDKLINEIIVINDVLGRLPLYYFINDDQFILSREIKFITKFIESGNLDKKGMAEYLLFGYPLGKRTLVKNVHRLDPGVIVKYNLPSCRLAIDRLHIWNLQNKMSEIKHIQKYADDLVTQFRSAIKSRVDLLDGFRNLISLSGGLDSRAVAISLNEVDPKLSAVTFLDPEQKNSKDADYAQKISKRFHIDWKLIELSKRRFEDMRELTKLKDGLNCADMGFILDFFIQIRHNFGNKVVYYTGDGGKILKPLAPVEKIESIDELVDMIFIEHSNVFKINEIAKLIDVNEEEIKKDIKHILLDYPENDLIQKYIHFIIFERTYKWAFEGEDRNRFFFWSTSPFFSTPFFKYAISIPDNYKKNFKLYKMFLESLNTESLKIPYANWPRIRLLPISLSYSLIPEVYYKFTFFRKLIMNLKKISADTKYDPNINIINFHEPFFPLSLGNYISLSELRRLLSCDLNKLQFFTLITILLYAQYLEDLGYLS